MASIACVHSGAEDIVASRWVSNDIILITTNRHTLLSQFGDRKILSSWRLRPNSGRSFSHGVYQTKGKKFIGIVNNTQVVSWSYDDSDLSQCSEFAVSPVFALHATTSLEPWCFLVTADGALLGARTSRKPVELKPSASLGFPLWSSLVTVNGGWQLWVISSTPTPASTAATTTATPAPVLTLRVLSLSIPAADAAATAQPHCPVLATHPLPAAASPSPAVAVADACVMTSQRQLCVMLTDGTVLPLRFPSTQQWWLSSPSPCRALNLPAPPTPPAADAVAATPSAAKRRRRSTKGSKGGKGSGSGEATAPAAASAAASAALGLCSLQPGLCAAVTPTVSGASDALSVSLCDGTVAAWLSATPIPSPSLPAAASASSRRRRSVVATKAASVGEAAFPAGKLLAVVPAAGYNTAALCFQRALYIADFAASPPSVARAMLQSTTATAAAGAATALAAAVAAPGGGAAAAAFRFSPPIDLCAAVRSFTLAAATAAATGDAAAAAAAADKNGDDSDSDGDGDGNGEALAADVPDCALLPVTAAQWAAALAEQTGPATTAAAAATKAGGRGKKRKSQAAVDSSDGAGGNGDGDESVQPLLTAINDCAAAAAAATAAAAADGEEEAAGDGDAAALLRALTAHLLSLPVPVGGTKAQRAAVAAQLQAEAEAAAAAAAAAAATPKRSSRRKRTRGDAVTTATATAAATAEEAAAQRQASALLRSPSLNPHLALHTARACVARLQSLLSSSASTAPPKAAKGKGKGKGKKGKAKGAAAAGEEEGTAQQQLLRALRLVVCSGRLSARGCRQLLPTVLKTGDLAALEDCLLHLQQLSERALITALRFLLTTAKPSALLAFAEGSSGATAAPASAPHVLLRFLCLLTSLPVNTAFLRTRLQALSLKQAVATLGLLHHLLSLYSQRYWAHLAKQLSLPRAPSLRQVLNWACVLIDAHFTAIVTDAARDPALHTLLSNVKACLAQLCSGAQGMAPLKGPLLHVIRGDALPVTPTPDFSVELFCL